MLGAILKKLLNRFRIMKDTGAISAIESASIRTGHNVSARIRCLACVWRIKWEYELEHVCVFVCECKNCVSCPALNRNVLQVVLSELS